MRTFVITLSLSLCLFIANANANKVLRLSEPVHSDASSETFGKLMNNKLPLVSLAELKSTPDTYLAKPFRLEARVAKVCQKKGCFFIAQQGEHVIRVAFRDYGFFIPTDSHGKTMMLSGELIARQMSKAQAEHFKQDMQSSKGIAPGKVYEIIADSVTIPL